MLQKLLSDWGMLMPFTTPPMPFLIDPTSSKGVYYLSGH